MSYCGVACGQSQFSFSAQGVDSVLAVKRPVMGGTCRRNPQHFGVRTQVRGFSAQVIHRFVHRKASKQVSCRARRQQRFGVLVLAGHAACRELSPRHASNCGVRSVSCPSRGGCLPSAIVLAGARRRPARAGQQQRMGSLAPKETLVRQLPSSHPSPPLTPLTPPRTSRRSCAWPRCFAARPRWRRGVCGGHRANAPPARDCRPPAPPALCSDSPGRRSSEPPAVRTSAVPG
jgi:hypothetical protein